MIKPAYSVSFLLSIKVFVWQNVLYFLDAPRIMDVVLDGCTIYRLLLVLTQRDVLYQNNIIPFNKIHSFLKEISP